MLRNRVSLLGLSRAWWLWLGLIVALAAVLRFYRVGANSLWLDEIFTALFSAPDKTLAEIARTTLDLPLPAPPLWFYTTQAFVKLFGEGEFVVRLPAVLAGCLGVVAMYLTATSLFDKPVGLLSALLLATSSMHIYVSREARTYPATVLLTLLSIYFLHQGARKRSPWWAWVGFVVVTLLNLYTHLTALLVLAGQMAYVVSLLGYQWWREARAINGAVDGGKSEKAKGWLFLGTLQAMFQRDVLRAWLGGSFLGPACLSLLAIALAYAPMVPYLLTGAAGERGIGNPNDIPGMSFSLVFVLGVLMDLGAGRGLPLSLYVAAAFLGIVGSIRAYPRQIAQFGFVSVTPFVILFVLRPKHWFSTKYAVFILPMLLIVVALGIVYLARSLSKLVSSSRGDSRARAVQRLSLIVIVAIFIGVNLLSLDEAHGQRPGRWRDMAQFLLPNMQADDAVVTLPTTIRTMDTAELLSYYGPSSEEATVIEAETVEQLEAAAVGHRRLWILMDRPDMAQIEPMLAWVEQQPFVPLRLERAGKESPSMILYLGSDSTQEALLEELEAADLTMAYLHGSLAEMYLLLKRPAEALAHYEQAIALSEEKGGAAVRDVSVWKARVQLLGGETP